MTYNGIPVFMVNVDNPDCSINTMSLVDDPAMSIDMVCFSEEKQKMNFSIQDEQKHNILTCLVRVDFPILRLTEEGNPYYIVFSKETSEKLCQRLMTDGYQQNISLDHNGKLIEGVILQEVFIKDSTLGLSPVGFEDAADGSLMGVYHITDDALWQDCLDGKFKGISIESYLSLESFKKINNNDKKIMAKQNRIKETLKMLLMEFNNLSTNKAELYWEEDSELMVGYKVFVEDAEGNKVPAADGEYISDENKIKVEGGVVTEIEAKEADETPAEEKPAEEEAPAEEKPAEEMAEETPAEEAPAEPETPAEEAPAEEEDKTAELEGRIAALEEKIAELEAKLVEIATAPAATPIVDEFENIQKKVTTGDKKLDKRIALAAALKQN